MAQDRAAQKGNTAAEPRRKWQRRPASRRLDLTPEQIEAEETERRRHMRTAHIGIQVSEEERAEVERRAQAQHVRLSDYVRDVILSPEKAPLPPARDAEAIRALAFQLSKIGTNLNQMAYVANERRALPQEDKFKALADKIVAALDKVYGL